MSSRTSCSSQKRRETALRITRSASDSRRSISSQVLRIASKAPSRLPRSSTQSFKPSQHLNAMAARRRGSARTDRIESRGQTSISAQSPLMRAAEFEVCPRFSGSGLVLHALGDVLQGLAGAFVLALFHGEVAQGDDPDQLTVIDDRDPADLA